MSNNRYRIITQDKEPQYTGNIAVILKATAITKDEEENKVLVQCKFENLGEKQITTMYISLKCYDAGGNCIKTLENFSYTGLKVKQYDEFGSRTPIYLLDHESRKVVITLKKVVYSDGDVWVNKEETPYQKIVFDTVHVYDLVPFDEDYRKGIRKIGTRWAAHEYLPSYANIFMRCGCGKLILTDTENCPSCGIHIEKLKEFAKEFDEIVQIKIKTREEKARKERERLETIKFHIKKNKKRIILASVLVCCFIIIGVSALKIINNNRAPFDRLSPEMNERQVKRVLGDTVHMYDDSAVYLDMKFVEEEGTLVVKYGDDGKVKSAVWAIGGDNVPERKDKILEEIHDWLTEKTGLMEPIEIEEKYQYEEKWEINNEEVYKLKVGEYKISLSVNYL